MTPRYRLVAGLVAGLLAPLSLTGLSLIAMPGSAIAQTTTWTANEGDWGTASNWSNGEPTAGVDAVVNTTASVMVTQGGEICRGLTLSGPLGARLDLTGGALTADHVSTGTGGTIGISATGNAVFSVTHSLTVGTFSDMVANGGITQIGSLASDSLVVLGTFQIAGTPTLTVSNLALHNGSVYSILIPFTGITGLVTTGTAVLNGKLLVQDFSFSSADVTYEIIHANQIVGTFDEVQLPATGNWSWRIEGNSVFITRGTVATEPATWSDLKAGAGRPAGARGITGR
ncbi:MAG TPA: hypothetical protein VF720_02315 [Candidatus Eisenbacteria bacterium]